MRRVAVKTVGCRLNQAESAHITAQFTAGGYRLVPFGNACEVGVIHSCSVTSAADRTSLRLARTLKRKFPRAVVILAGCAVEADRERVRRLSGADIVAGQDEKFDLPGLVARQFHGGDPAPCAVPAAPVFDTTRALLRVQDGCDFHCAYCVVPHTRGPSRSRPFRDILDEAGALAERGFSELVVTGANVGCYADGGRRLVDVLAAVEAIAAISRIRISSVEPSTTERAIIDYMSTSRKLCRFLHLPLQSGDDRILAAMRRRYSSGDYRRFVDYAVQHVPRLGLGTDLIVGHPGETDSAFANTRSLVEALPFSNLHVFPFSPRPGTPACIMPGRVAAATRRARAAELIALGLRKRAAFARQFVRQEVTVLVEDGAANGRAVGWTGEYLRASLPGGSLRENDLALFVPSHADDDLLVGEEYSTFSLA